MVETVTAVLAQKKVLGPKLKQAPKGTMKLLVDALEAMSSVEALALKEAIAAGTAKVEVEGVSYPVTADMVEIKEIQRKTSGQCRWCRGKKVVVDRGKNMLLKGAWTFLHSLSWLICDTAFVACCLCFWFHGVCHYGFFSPLSANVLSVGD